jgi:hypothetical protein
MKFFIVLALLIAARAHADVSVEATASVTIVEAASLTFDSQKRKELKVFSTSESLYWVNFSTPKPENGNHPLISIDFP